jgi:hypothetical protein
MQDGKFKLKNRMRQPLPLEYATKSISLAAGGILECTEAEFLCAEIQRNINGKRLKLIAVPMEIQPKEDLATAVHAEEEVQEVIMEDLIVHEMVPETAGPVQEAELEEEKDGDSLTSKSSEPDNGTVEPPTKKRRKRSRSGKRDDKEA